MTTTEAMTEGRFLGWRDLAKENHHCEPPHPWTPWWRLWGPRNRFVVGTVWECSCRRQFIFNPHHPEPRGGVYYHGATRWPWIDHTRECFTMTCHAPATTLITWYSRLSGLGEPRGYCASHAYWLKHDSGFLAINELRSEEAL